MIYTPKIQKAIDFAIEVHEVRMKQKRKGKDIPYIVHPLAVGLILAKAGAGENAIIAGILHDTIEDSKEEDKTQVRKFIEQEFGEEIYRTVDDVTEQDKSLPWEERKQIALEHIIKMGNDSLLVKSADVLHNMTDLVQDLEREGDKVFEHFNAPKEKQLERYTNLVKAFEDAWPENPLLPDLKENLKSLLRY
jgi:(p)ppGpp synthase/HD superfamily hydrolase